MDDGYKTNELVRAQSNECKDGRRFTLLFFFALLQLVRARMYICTYIACRLLFVCCSSLGHCIDCSTSPFHGLLSRLLSSWPQSWCLSRVKNRRGHHWVYLMSLPCLFHLLSPDLRPKREPASLKGEEPARTPFECVRSRCHEPHLLPTVSCEL